VQHTQRPRVLSRGGVVMHACKQQSMVRGCQQDKKEGRRSKVEDKKQERESTHCFAVRQYSGFALCSTR
jgi:hypothetical protein